MGCEGATPHHLLELRISCSWCSVLVGDAKWATRRDPGNQVILSFEGLLTHNSGKIDR
jgi:hypothetical protein